MNTVNKENYHFTYEDIVNMAKLLPEYADGINLIPAILDDRKFSYDDLINISPEKSQELFNDIIKLHPDYSRIVLDFANLVDTNEKYVIIDRLLAIINSQFHYNNKSDDDFIIADEKYDLLNTTLNILKYIKSNNVVIKSLIKDHKEKSYDLILMFLSKSVLCNYLLENKEFMKQAKVYDETLNLFPLIKDNQR